MDTEIITGMEQNEHKIESSFSKKLKVKKQKDLLANTDDTMEQTNTTIKVKRSYNKKPKLVVAEPPAPLTIEEEFKPADEDEIETCKGCGEVDGEEQYGWYCETCYGEKLGHYPQATDQQEEQDEEQEEEEDEEKILLAKLAEIKKKKVVAQARENIGELRQELKTYQRGLIEKAQAEVKRLQEQYEQIDEGVFDEELIAKKTQPKSSSKERKTNKAVGAVGEGKFRHQATENLNTKYDAFKKQLLGGGLFTKSINGYSWTLYGKGEHLVVKYKEDGEVKYALPTFKDVPAMCGEGNTFDKNTELKEWIKSNLQKKN
jgi:hypothetical protein